MDRMWSSGASVTPPALTNASSGFATSGNPGTGTPATKPGAHMWHMVVEELIALILAGDITLDKTDVSQVLASLQSMLSGGAIANGKIVVTHSAVSHTWTVALKTLGGADASATCPIFIAFRHGTAGDGSRVMRKVTGALSMVISSGSTLGHTSGANHDVFVYAIDNAGTVELAVSKLSPGVATFGSTRLVSTTAEGGAGAADSGTVAYSTTARSNVPWVCLGRAVSNQATAGTWDAAAVQVDMAPFSSMGATQGTFTATLTGVSGSVTSTATYLVIGDMVFCHINTLSGTSNSTAATITGFPAAIWPITATQSGVHSTYQNGGVNGVAGGFNMATNGVMTLAPGPIGTAWTGSGNKIIDRQLLSWRIA